MVACPTKDWDLILSTLFNSVHFWKKRLNQCVKNNEYFKRKSLNLLILLILSIFNFLKEKSLSSG